MDPITIIGTAGALCNIIDVLYKTIQSAIQLRNQYSDADMTMLSLIAQLTALKAALSKIQDIIDGDSGDLYHQFIMDLDTSITCVRLLIGKIEGQFSELKTNEKGMDFTSKVKFVFGSRGVEETQRMIDHQTSALILLLNAITYKTVSEQQGILEKSETRKVMQRMQWDSESLVVHRDTDSFFSRYTDKLSKLSLVFHFDREFLITRVYEKALRSSLKHDLRIKQRRMISESSKEDKARSVAIDRRLKQDSRGLCQNVKVLLFGLEDSGKDAMVKHMKLKSANGYTRSELIEWRQMIKAKLLRNVFVLLDAMEQCGIEPGNESNISHCEFLMRCRLDNPMNGRLDFHIGVAIQALWNDPCMAKVLKHSAGTDYTLDGEARYLFEQTSRIVQPHYEPTVEDILRTNDESRGIRETDFVFETFQMTIFDINTRQLGEQQKWIHAFETVTSIMFVVDLADYESIHSDHDSGGMTESLTLFDSMVNSRWFSRSSVILFLTNMHAFRNKLLRTPFSSYFPDYTGPDDAAAILQYIIKRFNACNRCHLDFFPHVLELSDPVSLKLLLKAVQETTVNNALRTLGKI